MYLLLCVPCRWDQKQTLQQSLRVLLVPERAPCCMVSRGKLHFGCTAAGALPLWGQTSAASRFSRDFSPLFRRPLTWRHNHVVCCCRAEPKGVQALLLPLYTGVFAFCVPAVIPSDEGCPSSLRMPTCNCTRLAIVVWTKEAQEVGANERGFFGVVRT